MDFNLFSGIGGGGVLLSFYLIVGFLIGLISFFSVLGDLRNDINSERGLFVRVIIIIAIILIITMMWIFIIPTILIELYRKNRDKSNGINEEF